MRLVGVANSDSHTLFRETGQLRNFVKSSTDDPARIDEMELVREGALPGDTTTRGQGTLKVRVEGANWVDVDRV